MFNNTKYPRKKGGGYFSKKKISKKSKGLPKALNWQLFVKKAIPTEERDFVSVRKFKDFGFHPRLNKTLDYKGFVFPTEIQEKTLDYSMDGRDILGIADTGTGKTGAFLIPVIDRLLKSKERFQTMVVVPTRELANQVEEEFISLSHSMRLFSVCLTGGTSVGRNIKRLNMFNHIIIGTPGRLIDMVERDALDLSVIEVLILDEFDRMLDMGFVDDVKFLMSQMKSRKQTMLFSATIDKKLKPLIDQILDNPFEVMVGTGEKASENVEQDIVKIERGENKFDRLLGMMNQPDFNKVLIFTETKKSVDDLHYDLIKAGIKTDLIHGDKTQRSREMALVKFKEGKIRALVATDVAARGLDIKGVSHVINYEAPKDYQSYVHRIGRTGRAGKKGYAYTFVE